MINIEVFWSRCVFNAPCTPSYVSTLQPNQITKSGLSIFTTKESTFGPEPQSQLILDIFVPGTNMCISAEWGGRASACPLVTPISTEPQLDPVLMGQVSISTEKKQHLILRSLDQYRANTNSSTKTNLSSPALVSHCGAAPLIILQQSRCLSPSFSFSFFFFFPSLFSHLSLVFAQALRCMAAGAPRRDGAD